VSHESSVGCYFSIVIFLLHFFFWVLRLTKSCYSHALIFCILPQKKTKKIMRIKIASYLGLVLVSGFVAGGTAAAAAAADAVEDDQSGIPSSTGDQTDMVTNALFVTKDAQQQQVGDEEESSATSLSKTNLRHSLQQTSDRLEQQLEQLQEEKIKISQLNDMSPEERVAFAESLQKSLDTALEALDGIVQDHSEEAVAGDTGGNTLTKLSIQLQNQGQEASRWVAEVIDFIKDMTNGVFSSDNESPPPPSAYEETETEETKGDIPSIHIDGYEDEEAEEMVVENSSLSAVNRNRRLQYWEEKYYKPNTRDRSSRGRRKLDDEKKSSNGKPWKSFTNISPDAGMLGFEPGSFAHQKFSQHAPRMKKIHHALHSDNAEGLKAAFASSTPGYHYHKPDLTSSERHRRRTKAAHGHRQLTRTEQCGVLLECASQMSIYDTFVFFYSDDIDPNTGEVDDNLVKFDEENFFEKYNAIRTKVQNVAATDAHACSQLLQLFHRTIENGKLSFHDHEQFVFVQCNSSIAIIICCSLSSNSNPTACSSIHFHSFA
jgi:hypothetical protein